MKPCLAYESPDRRKEGQKGGRGEEERGERNREGKREKEGEREKII